MDLDDPKSLADLLEPSELEKIPVEVQEKLKTALNGVIDIFCKEKTASYRIGDYEQKTEELQNEIQDYQEKMRNYEQNVTELRTQLDQVSSERGHLLDTANNHETDVVKLRKEKNELVEERNALLKLIERHTSEEHRMKSDIQTYQHQLNNAISAKCEAIARVDEIESKEVAFQMKERRMEQEQAMMQSEIQMLRDDLNRNMTEVQNLRRESAVQTMHLDTRLSQKTNELKILKAQLTQYTKTIDELNESVRNNAQKLLEQKEESDNLLENYKKELDMKAKLVELYKGSIEDSKAERNELTSAIAELRRMLSESSDQYGALETELKSFKLKYDIDIEEKNKSINALKEELVHANELLKEMQQESVESAISKLAPTAAITSRLIRSDMSLTELYSQYAKATEELELQKRENARLNLHMKNILDELNERAPLLKKQQIEYSKLVELNNTLSQQQDELIKQKLEMEHHLNESELKISHLERENKKLTRSHDDTLRQMTCLIHEVEHLRVGLEPNAPPNTGSMTTSDEVITKKLVTFRNIEELQENNQKLLILVRDLTTKLEEIETQKPEIDETTYKEKLESYGKKVKDMHDTLEQKNNALKTCLAKCERYKTMYFEQQKSLGKQVTHAQIDKSLLESTSQDGEVVSATAEKSRNELDADSERKIRKLEQQLEDINKQYKSVKEHYEYYKGEKQNNDKLFQEQFDSMRTEVRQLTSSNCKLTNTLEYLKEQKQLLQKNNSTYKQQIEALEERNRNYETTIIKHEQTVHLLKDEILSCQRRTAMADTEANNLRHENRILKDTNGRLQAEKEIFNREHQSQAMMLNNLEYIKTNLERSESEGRTRAEHRLEEVTRELAAQRRHFQEEEDRYRERMNDFSRQTETAKKQMEEEKQQADKLRDELATLRGELTVKTNQIDDLSKKLQESLTPSKDDNPITAANKKARDFELKYEEAKIEIESLSTELAKAREHGEQFYKMSQNAEGEIKRLHDIHTAYVSSAEAKMEQLKQSEAALKTRISDLEAENMLTNVTEQSKNTNQSDQLKLAQEELKNALHKLTDANGTIRTLRAENSSLTESLNVVEMKYANEMILHSADIQESTKMKAELTKIQDQIQELHNSKDSSLSSYEELKKAHDELQKTMKLEKQEFEKRIEDLNSLNSNLHDQIEALTSKMFLLSQSSGNHNPSHNESAMDSSMSELNQSKLDEENKNNEQLLQIIKFLRKEKDLSTAKLDIIKAENVRLVSEHTILQKKIDELNGYLNQERSRSESNMLCAVKHEEVLRKIETINAMTDSNRILREERNTLTARVTELKNHISKIEEELFPLKTQTGELTSKVDELSLENSSLRTEAMKWRQRANALVEKSNKNPEEFKRLQMERENLAKMLTTEKEVQKKAMEEIAVLKSRLENDVPMLSKQVQALSEERKKLFEETLAAKQNNARMSQELMELKNRLLQKEDELQRANEELQSKENQMQDLRSKELQIRKIAKRYKDSYTELAKKSNMDIGEGSMVEDNSNNANTELENLRSQVEGLTNTVSTKEKQLEELQQEYDEHKKKAEVQTNLADLLRDAKSRLVQVKEAKNQIQQEFANYKKQQQTQQANEDSTLAGVKASYDEKISNLEKELQEQINLNKEATLRLTRENESLHMRINQLNRQLGLQQSSKPTTSSVAITEKGGISESSPRTANVKPMSGSATVQQSATVTPWRGSGETPLASIRPISVQNSRTAAILPTSQQTSAGSSSTSSTSTTSSSGSGSTSSTGNTALVPPQQQVHTTGSSSLESMASSSPTSSHTDYMPSTSSAAVAVAAIPPMGAATAAESSQEAESIQQPQQNDAQLYVSGGQQQVVALVSPRVEGSSTSSSSTTTTSTQNTTTPSVQLSQDSGNQQPSTSGSSSSSTVVSSHSRHTPSSSSVTTTQAGCSSIGHKRPRDVDGDSTNVEEGSPEKMSKATKRLRTPLHGSETSAQNVGDSGIDVDQMPTSSQRDQEDDVVVVVSEDDEEHVMAEADDDEPMEDGGDVEQESYDYENENEIDENDCPEGGNEGAEIHLRDQDNEVDIDEGPEQHSQQCSSGTENQAADDVPATNAAATSEQENHQQIQAISSGSSESNSVNIPQSAAGQWKQASSSSTLAAAIRRTDNSVEIVSSPQVSKFAYNEQSTAAENAADPNKTEQDNANNENDGTSESYTQKTNEEGESASEEAKKSNEEEVAASAEDGAEVDEDFGEETASGTVDASEQSDAHHSGSASQSEIQDNQLSQIEATSEDNEGTDGVSSEGEKQTVEGVEEEGREAEATTSPTMNTRSKTMRGATTMRRGGRISNRGNNNNNNNRPTPIIWQQDAPGNSRNMHNLRHQDQQVPGSPNRNFNAQRGQRGRRTIRRPPGNPYNSPNMRFP